MEGCGEPVSNLRFSFPSGTMPGYERVYPVRVGMYHTRVFQCDKSRRTAMQIFSGVNFFGR